MHTGTHKSQFSQGGYKLKIPKLLLHEKEKTRSRFAQVHALSHILLFPKITYVKKNSLIKKQMKKKEGVACIKKDEEEGGSSSGEGQRGKHCISDRVTMSSKLHAQGIASARGAPAESATPHASSSSKQSLSRRVMAEITSVIVPIGKKRQSNPASLPKRSSFVFTEEHALKKIVRRMVRECPGMCAQVRPALGKAA